MAESVSVLQERLASEQKLVALIDRVPTYQGPWLVNLDRKERVALTRSPGGLSGRSWMGVAAADTPLAALWLERDSTETTVDVLRRFRVHEEALRELAALYREASWSSHSMTEADRDRAEAGLRALDADLAAAAPRGIRG